MVKIKMKIIYKIIFKKNVNKLRKMKYNSIVNGKPKKRWWKNGANELTEGNKDVLNLVAKGMLIAQDGEKIKEGGNVRNDKNNN